MISEDELTKMIEPILANQYDINMEVICALGYLVSENGGIENQSQVDSLTRMAKNNKDLLKLIQRLNEVKTSQASLLNDYFTELAMSDYALYFAMYGDDLVEFDDTDISDRAKEVGNDFVSRYKGWMNSPKIIMRDIRAPSITKPYTLTQAFNSINQETKFANTQKIMPYDNYMQRTLTQIGESGLRTTISSDGKITYPKLESYLKSQLLDTTYSFLQEIESIIGDKLELDGVEITIVPNPAPDHEPIQGHRFTNAEFEKLQDGDDFKDVNDIEFDAITRPIGFWNCRHVAMAVDLSTKPKYTQTQLDKMVENNHKVYKLSNGHEFTQYQASQRQRQLENRLRKYMENYSLAVSANNKVMKDICRQKITRDTQEYAYLTKFCRLKSGLSNIKVLGYNKKN